MAPRTIIVKKKKANKVKLPIQFYFNSVNLSLKELLMEPNADHNESSAKLF